MPVPRAPFLLPYEDTWPVLATEPRSCGPGVSLIGKVRIGAKAAFGPGTVIRADGHFVRIGDDFRSGEMSTVHVARDAYPTIIGDRVSIGRNAVVHACTVGSDCVIGDGVVLLDGSVVEDGVLVEEGSTVFPRTILETGTIYAGSPAKPARKCATGELARRRAALDDAIAVSPVAAPFAAKVKMENISHDAFVAKTASLVGNITLGRGASVFFGCRLDAGQAQIVVGENTNIQDNTCIAAAEGDVIVGRDTTIGHNVTIRSCDIGDRSLIGIGSDLGAGTMVGSDVLLAAGSTTLPGQLLEAGWFWAGRPARPVAQLSQAKRAMMQPTIALYCGYAAAYRLAQNS